MADNLKMIVIKVVSLEKTSEFMLEGMQIYPVFNFWMF